MSNVDEDSNHSADAQSRQMSDVDEADQYVGDLSHTGGVSVPAPAKDHRMRDRPAAVHVRLIRRRKSRRGILIHWRHKIAKAKNMSREIQPGERSSALATFISAPPSLEPHNTSQLKILQDDRMMTILIRRDGEWEEIRKCRRCYIINTIKEVRCDNPEQD
ncbi:hypothetical protein F4802DRAFT_440973 [Xylaria palmicola]|nr:hypothetical protein F4802DRAFT_440973 [Xylaria palmicola]